MKNEENQTKKNIPLVDCTIKVKEDWLKPEIKFININDATLGSGANGSDCNTATSGCFPA